MLARVSNRRRRLAGVARAAAVAMLAALVAAACHRAPSCDAKSRARLDFSVKDMNGQDVRLASYSGRPLLLNFWATWCGPCKEEIPALIALNDQYTGAPTMLERFGLKAPKPVILGISVDDTPAELQKFAAANKMNYPVLVGLGHDDLLEAYDAQIAVPVSWIVASNGCVIQKRAGGATKDWFAQQMKALL